MPRPPAPDPRMPRLAEVSKFKDWMAQGWGSPALDQPVTNGAAKAAAARRARLSEALHMRS